MDRDDIITMAKSYGHRSNLTTEWVDYFLANAHARLGRDLRSNENLVNSGSTYTGATSSPLALPADFGAIYALTYGIASGPVTLTSMDRHSINYWRQSGGTPARYSIDSTGIVIRPFASGDYVLTYWSRPELPLGTSTNAVLDRWPMLYLAALLWELHLWERDMVRAVEQRDAYMDEIFRINRSAQRARDDKPAMRRA